jgi:hypothetical protein
MKSILNKLSKLLDFNIGRIKPPVPPPLVLLSQTRSGLSPLKITQAILAKKKELGLPTGNLEDGTANYDDIIIKEIVTQVIKAIQEDARITVVIPPGTPLIASGANSGGPLIAHGTTLSFAIGGALIE